MCAHQRSVQAGCCHGAGMGAAPGAAMWGAARARSNAGSLGEAFAAVIPGKDRIPGRLFGRLPAGRRHPLLARRWLWPRTAHGVESAAAAHGRPLLFCCRHVERLHELLEKVHGWRRRRGGRSGWCWYRQTVTLVVPTLHGLLRRGPAGRWHPLLTRRWLWPRAAHGVESAAAAHGLPLPFPVVYWTGWWLRGGLRFRGRWG